MNALRSAPARHLINTILAEQPAEDQTSATHSAHSSPNWRVVRRSIAANT
jgi:hypothetical protein